MVSKLALATALAVLASIYAVGSTARVSSPFPSGWIVLPIPPTGTENAELFRVRTDGSGLHQMTDGPGIVQDPDFAPNGKRLVFARFGRGIFTIGIDGSGLRRLTPHGYDQYPVYSPDGKRIAFIRDDRPWVMQSNGRRQHLLRRAPRLRDRPSWSPDGRKIVIGAGGTSGAFLYTLNAGTGRLLKRTLLMDGYLANGYGGSLLAPDGRTVVFYAYRPPPPDCETRGCDEVFALYRRTLARGISSTGVVCNDCAAAAWSTDGRVLLVTRAARLELRVVRDGRTKVIDLHGYERWCCGAATLQPR